MKKDSFLLSITNNGFMSNLMYGAFMSAFVGSIRFLVGKIADNPVMPDIATIIAALLAFTVAWFIHRRSHSGEKFWSNENAFSTISNSRLAGDKSFVDKFEAGDVKVRRDLYDWLIEWIGSIKDIHGTSRICVISGKQNVGRTSVVVHAALQVKSGEKDNETVLYFSSGFNCEAGEKLVHVREEWRETLAKWIRATKRKRRYIILISSRNISVKDVLSARELANSLRKRICFILKDPKPFTLDGDISNSEDKRFDIRELTPEECQTFLYKYASKTERLVEYAELKKSYYDREGKEDYGNWFRNCSGGRPSRLIRFFNNSGRSRPEILGEWYTEMSLKTDNGWGLGETELAFLWCLCVERRCVAMRNPNGVVDINKICKRVDGKDPTRLAQKLFKTELTGGRSISVLDGYFANSIVQIPEEAFISSFGYWDDVSKCQGGIANWIRSMLQDNDEAINTHEYVEILAETIIESLMTAGFLANPRHVTDIKEAMSAICSLELQVGMSGTQDVDDRIKRFFSDLKELFIRRIIDECLEDVGFGGDANIVAVITTVLDICEDRTQFFAYYALALPLFGLLICNPIELAPIKKFLHMLYDGEEMGLDEREQEAAYVLLHETYFLCGIRIQYSGKDDIEQFIADPKNLLFPKIENYAKNGDKISDAIVNLAMCFEQHDVQSFAVVMNELLKLIRKPEWDGLKIIIAIALAYISTPDAKIDDKVLKKFLDDIGECRLELDPENKIVIAARFSVMMRRAFYRYRDNDSLDPWIIDVDEDETKQDGEKSIAVRLGRTNKQRQRVSGLNPNDLLRCLPVIVRQFAECTCLKKRGLAEFEKVLEEDWRKISQIVTNEKWFESINRRSRCWIMFWSSMVVRDVMDEVEQRRFLERVKIMCEEVLARKDEQDSLWYRLLTLRTIENVIKDKPLLNKIARFVYKFILDDYHSVIDRNSEFELQAWRRCAMELFGDWLCVVSIDHEPIEIFKAMFLTLLGDHVETDEEIVNEYLRCHAENRGAFDSAFIEMLIDIWNINCSCKILPGSVSRKFVEYCFDSNFIELLEAEIDDGQRRPSDDWLIGNFLRIVTRVVALCVMWRGYLEKRAIEVVIKCIDMCKTVENYRGIATPLRSIMRLSDEASPSHEEFLLKCKDFFGKWDEICTKDFLNGIDWECDNAQEEQQLLQRLWSCPLEYFKLFDEESRRNIYRHLEFVLDRFSSKWQEGFRSDWYHVFTTLLKAECLDECPESLLSKLEQLYFNGDFEKFCPEVRAKEHSRVDILGALAEKRSKWTNCDVTEVINKYNEALSSLKEMLGINDLDMMRDKAKNGTVLWKMVRLNDIIKSWESQVGESQGVATKDGDEVDVQLDASVNGEGSDKGTDM